MNKRDFIRQRRPAWIRFSRLVSRLQSGSFRTVSGDGVLEFSRLFREVTHDLAEVRSRDWGGRLESYLNDLAAQGHNIYYRAPPGKMRALIEFLSVGYPRVFRQYQGYFFVAAAVFAIPLILTWVIVQNNPGLASRIIPDEQLQGMEMMYDHDPETREAGPNDQRVMMSGFYIYNNIGIALRVFVSGLCFGVMTVYVLLSNGITIGAVAGYLISQGHGKAFTAFVISHGAFELTAIAVAGGAGLILGNALLHPGNHSRLGSLRVHGLAAVQIAGGAVFMLFIAALLEAFFSPTSMPLIWRYLIGGSLWILVFLYLFLVGRQGAPADRNEELAGENSDAFGSSRGQTASADAKPVAVEVL